MLFRYFFLHFYLIMLTQYTFALPEWIWVEDKKKATIGYDFEKRLENIKSAELRIVSDYANVSVTLNGNWVGIAEGFGPVLKANALDHLVDGRNEIILNIKSTGKAPALALKIDLIDRSDKKQTIATSREWKP